MISSELVKNNFSKYANYYDHYASIQKDCANQLIREVNGQNYRDILDIGCGTGIYTKLLSQKFPQATIKALDLSDQMIEVAKQKFEKGKINFIIANAEKLNINQKFDLITSNAAFQWFSDLKKMLERYKKLLKKKGCILFSIFGPKTFYELKICLTSLCSENNSITSSKFRKKSEIISFLDKNFAKSYLREETFEEKLDNIEELLKKIKYTGTRGFGLSQRRIWTKEKIKELEKIYLKKFGKVIASYQVFFVKAYE